MRSECRDPCTPISHLQKKQKSHKLNRRMALWGTHNYTPTPARCSLFQSHFHQRTPEETLPGAVGNSLVPKQAPTASHLSWQGCEAEQAFFPRVVLKKKIFLKCCNVLRGQCLPTVSSRIVLVISCVTPSNGNGILQV